MIILYETAISFQNVVVVVYHTVLQLYVSLHKKSGGKHRKKRVRSLQLSK